MRITRWRYAEMMFIHSLADFSEDRWAVQVTVAAITVNAQANSSPKRHEPLQGLGTFDWTPAEAYTWRPLGLFHAHGTDEDYIPFARRSVLDDLEYSHSASAHLVPASA